MSDHADGRHRDFRKVRKILDSTIVYLLYLLARYLVDWLTFRKVLP
jgi:hypothetical protein